MSLINEALKKAQRQRSLDNAPLSSAPSGVAAAAVTTHVATATRRRSYAPVWFGLGLLVLGVGATFLIMRYGFGPTDRAPSAVSEPAVARSDLPAAAPAVAPSVVAPAAPAPTPAAEAPAAPFVSLPTFIPPPPTPPASPEPSAPAVAVAVPVAVSPPPPAPLAPVAVPVPVAPVPAPPTAAEREAQIYTFLNSLRLAGVRGVDREARVLMNERVWRLNDVVSPELGLRLSAVRPNLLVFTDTQGKTYEKPF